MHGTVYAAVSAPRWTSLLNSAVLGWARAGAKRAARLSGHGR